MLKMPLTASDTLAGWVTSNTLHALWVNSVISGNYARIQPTCSRLYSKKKLVNELPQGTYTPIQEFWGLKKQFPRLISARPSTIWFLKSWESLESWDLWEAATSSSRSSINYPCNCCSRFLRCSSQNSYSCYPMKTELKMLLMVNINPIW